MQFLKSAWVAAAVLITLSSVRAEEPQFEQVFLETREKVIETQGLSVAVMPRMTTWLEARVVPGRKKRSIFLKVEVLLQSIRPRLLNMDMDLSEPMFVTTEPPKSEKKKTKNAGGPGRRAVFRAPCGERGSPRRTRSRDPQGSPSA